MLAIPGVISLYPTVFSVIFKMCQNLSYDHGLYNGFSPKYSIQWCFPSISPAVLCTVWHWILQEGSPNSWYAQYRPNRAREKHHGIYSISLRLFRSTRQRAEVHISINWGLREFHFSPPPSFRVFRKPGAELRDPPKGTSVHLSFIDHMLLFSEDAERSVKGNMRPNCFHHTQGRKLEPLPVTLTVIGSWSHFFCSG